MALIFPLIHFRHSGLVEGRFIIKKDFYVRIILIKKFTAFQNYLQTFVLDENDPIMTNTDEATQASLRLMDQIRSTRLFTMPTVPKPGDMMKLTQRDTNLCVAIAVMRLLCFALVEFLVKNRKQDKTVQDLEQRCEEIISFPKVESDKENKDHTSG